MHKKQITKCEYLSKDIFEEDFLKVFSSFYVVEYFLGFSRVEARDLFVSAPTWRQKIYTFFLISTALALFSINFFLYIENKWKDLYQLIVFAYLLTVFNYTSTVLHARFIRNDANVKFMIKLQEIDRLMGIAHNKTINDILYKINNITLALYTASFLIMFIGSCSGGILLAMTYTGGLWCFLANIMETTHCSTLVVYYIIRLRFINSVLANFIEGKPVENKKARFLAAPLKHVMRSLAAKTHDFSTTDTDVNLKALFESFVNFQDLYRWPVAVHFHSYFILIWVSVQYAVFELSSNNVKLMEWLIIPTLLVAVAIQSLTQVFRFEMLFNEIKETKRLAVAIMSSVLEGPLRQKAKRMYKLIRDSSPRFSVYDMWDMDAIFVVNFFYAVSSLVVTTLQFQL